MGQTIKGSALTRRKNFFFSKTSRAALEPKLLIQGLLGFFLLVKQLAFDVDPSPPTSTGVKNE